MVGDIALTIILIPLKNSCYQSLHNIDKTILVPFLAIVNIDIHNCYFHIDNSISLVYNFHIRDDLSSHLSF